VGILSFLWGKPSRSGPPAGAAAQAAPAAAHAGLAAVPAAHPAAHPAAPPGPISNAEANAIVVRSEIVDHRNRLCGYRFSMPAGGAGVPLGEASAIDVLVAAGLPGFAQRRLALVPISADSIVFNRHLPLMAPHTVFLLDRGHAQLPAEQLASRMAALRDAGCQVALRGIVTLQEQAPLLNLADVAVLALGDYTLAGFQTLTRQLRAAYPKMQLLIEGVASWDEQRMCLAWGCHYFMGQFLTTADKIDPDGKVDQSRLTSIELLNLLRSDAELAAMIEVAKRDPGMTFQVLQWANAPANGQTVKVTSLSQAFMVLGRNQLYRALTVSMFRLGGGANKERDESLLEVALTRARFLETVARDTLPPAQRDELFLVGMLSLFDVLMGVSMASLVDKMHLSDAIRDVLLHSEGPYSAYLILVLLLERDKIDRAYAIAESLGIQTGTLGQTAAAAFQWAQEAIGHTTAA
jgi:EAL and modified HD-GYP domain-containing signal transduction protein